MINWIAIFRFMEFLDKKGYYIMPHQKEELIKAELYESNISCYKDGRIICRNVQDVLKQEIRLQWAKIKINLGTTRGRT